MRILVDYRPALRERTGVGEYVHELCRALLPSPPGESLTLFSSSWKDRISPLAVPGAVVVDRRVPVGLLNAAWHRLEWPPAETLARGQFDIAHSTHPLLMPAANAAQVVTIYDLDFMDHPERTRGEIRRDYPGLVAAHARRADQVLVISDHTARDVERRLGVERARITTAYPGAPDWPRREHEPANGCILFLGTLEPRKNLGMLLDAYEHLIARAPKAPSLVLAGHIPPTAEALVARVRRPPLSGRVELTGYVPADGRTALYHRALVFVLPSHTEGFGMPAVEAMVTGVPVVAANRGALPEAVGSAGRLFEPDDAEGLAHALEEVVRDAALRERMRDAGWRQAATFQWSTTAARVREAWALADAHRRARHG